MNFKVIDTIGSGQSYTSITTSDLPEVIYIIEVLDKNIVVFAKRSFVRNYKSKWEIKALYSPISNPAKQL
ncbi:hypothetical protein MYP_3227 [Sporocytophaga myxococcoides]|uniref:Uncharacterized protein n=1 Tax=Sporocytophaga myxococcoides TaxID=153721 RepID=A0A098LIJ7_9BACT|nr:hypothetical protein [Sporocytophaga myxococcoides]GAL85998.1 hypothetical protein MYP_3227 [Sporocytophaga myxococcoides]